MGCNGDAVIDGYILHVAILGGEFNFVNNTGQKEDFHFEEVKALKSSPSQHTHNEQSIYVLRK